MKPKNFVESQRQEFGEFPTSAKLVYITLVYEGPLTLGELARETAMDKRTVRSALKELESADLVSSDVYIPDARKRIFRLPSDETELGT